MTTARLNTKRTVRIQQGFTLIELLVVIGILAILLAITLVAINPARQFAQANDTKRQSDVNSILNAIDEYAADNHGNLPPNMPAAGDPGEVVGNGSGQADLCASLVTRYLAALPTDPTGTNGGTAITDCTASYDTGYTASVSAGTDRRVTVSATGQISNPITVTR